MSELFSLQSIFTGEELTEREEELVDRHGEKAWDLVPMIEHLGYNSYEILSLDVETEKWYLDRVLEECNGTWTNKYNESRELSREEGLALFQKMKALPRKIRIGHQMYGLGGCEHPDTP